MSERIGVLHAQSAIIERARVAADGQSDLDKSRLNRDQRVALLLFGLLQEAGCTKFEIGALVTASEWMPGCRSGELTITRF